MANIGVTVRDNTSVMCGKYTPGTLVKDIGFGNILLVLDSYPEGKDTIYNTVVLYSQTFHSTGEMVKYRWVDLILFQGEVTLFTNKWE